MYKLHFASWLHTMHLFATFMRNNWKSWSVATFENQHMSVQVIFFPGIVLNFLKRVFHCVFLCILRCSCRKRQNVVHEVLFFMCCFSLCRNIKWPPLIFSYSLSEIFCVDIWSKHNPVRFLSNFESCHFYCTDRDTSHIQNSNADARVVAEKG